jgi:hypothetical protein
MSFALLVLLLLSAKGFVSLWRRRDRNLVWGFFFVFCVGFYVVGRGATWPSWYAIPPGLALFVMASHGVAPWLGSIPLRPRPQWLLLGALSILLFVVSLFTWPRIRSNYASQMEKTYGVVGRYLAENTSPSDTLLVREIGYIGFLADRYILDQAGIVSPPVLKLRLEDVSNGEPIRLIRRFRPQFVVERATFRGEVIQGEHGEWFDENYSRVQKTPWYHTFERIELRAE